MRHPTENQRRIRSLHGRCARGPSAAARSNLPRGVPGRDLEAANQRDPRAHPGRAVRHDYEYARNGTANLFMLFAPLEGWRNVTVTEHHAAVDYADILEDLSDRRFPEARKIVLVQDNLSTHKPASLCEAFPAPEARRLVERFEWHYMPKHGSWLNMAETELSVLARQCPGATRYRAVIGQAAACRRHSEATSGIEQALETRLKSGVTAGDLALVDQHAARAERDPTATVAARAKMRSVAPGATGNRAGIRQHAGGDVDAIATSTSAIAIAAGAATDRGAVGQRAVDDGDPDAAGPARASLGVAPTRAVVDCVEVGQAAARG